MRCVEAQELLSQGKSILYFNAPRRDSLSPFVDEVDNHVKDCPVCGEQLIQLLGRQLKRRPGPRHWLQVRNAIRKERASLAFEGIKVEEAPIVRVANTILMECIKQKATRIELHPITDVQPGPAAVDAEIDGGLAGSTNDQMKADIVKASSLRYSDPDSVSWSVDFEVDGHWKQRVKFPDYVMSPLFSRYKSMADMLVSLDTEPQHGSIPIRYENRDYTVNVRTTPEPYGERLLLEIAPA